MHMHDSIASILVLSVVSGTDVSHAAFLLAICHLTSSFVTRCFCTLVLSRLLLSTSSFLSSLLHSLSTLVLIIPAFVCVVPAPQTRIH